MPGADETDESDETELPEEVPLEANEADAAEQAREVVLWRGGLPLIRRPVGAAASAETRRPLPSPVFAAFGTSCYPAVGWTAGQLPDRRR